MVAVGTALSYQWQKDGVAISGATAATYTIASAAPTAAGNYTVTVTGGAGSVTSRAATLTVNTAPAFTTQPINQTAVVGGNVTFTVAASGTAPLAYQWFKDGIEVAGATDNSLTISGVKLSDGGSYQASVTNVANSIKAVSAGGIHSLYLKTDGTLWAMGLNQYGQLGDGTATDRRTAVQVATGVASVSAGSQHTLYVKTDGTLWAMGFNSSGQLGNGTTTNRSTAVQVATNVASVSAGTSHTMYVKTDGTLWAMGDNVRGQLGDGTTTQRNSPVQVGTGVASVAAGSGHTLYLKTDGTLWAMGLDSFGQLGGGTTTQRSTPEQVDAGVTSVESRGTHTVYLKTDGTLWAMGDNRYGQLGDGTATNRSTAVQVATGVASVSAGGAHSLYVKTDGTLWAMGYNNAGQLGDGTATNRSTAAQVATGVSGVSAGGNHTLYVKTDGTLWVMGSNFSGQLGDGTTTNRSTAVNIYRGPLSNVAMLILPPTIITQPSASTAAISQSVSFSVVAGSAALSYQWKKDGVAINGATAATYTIASAAPTAAGSYTVTVTNSAGSVTSTAVTLTVIAAATSPRLYSLAVRTALDAEQILIVGFNMSGGAKNVLLRAAGPTLGAFGVPETMVDPKLELYSGSTLVDSNDNWGGSPSLAATFQAAGAFAFSSTSSRDAALVASIDGGRTAHVSGPTAGAVLVEGYDVGIGDAQRFTSLSARNRVGTGANILIAGFNLSGVGTRNLLIRAVGPTLDAFGVPDVLADPKLEIYRGSVKISENDNWSSTLSTTFSSAGAFGLIPESKDAAITVSLPAGSYTVQVSGADGGVGEALVEIYELP